MALEEPVIPEWRAGRLSIGYQEERDLLMLEAEELLPEDEAAEQDLEAEDAEQEEEIEAEDGEELLEESLATLEAEENLASLEAELEAELGPELESQLQDEREPERGRVRFWATREQMLSLARHGAVVCAAGRPQCPLCHNPIDAEGHWCPALNGHKGEQPT